MTNISKVTKVSRKDQILQALARMLETSPGGRVTTAALAKEVGCIRSGAVSTLPKQGAHV